MPEGFYVRHGKRALDLLIAGPVFLLSLPLQAVVALLVRRFLGRPVLFRQRRPGRNGKPFQLVKFRTMREPDPVSDQADDAARMTPLGRVLRATSLDELPTLLNVLKGDMSLVGPRPLLIEYLCLYTAEQARRHDVRPGVTGLAQITGRNATTWESRLGLDVQYAETLSLRADIRILASTVRRVLHQEGVTQHGHVTMPRFEGVPHVG